MSNWEKALNLSAEDRSAIEAVVARAEKSTTGEIVPMIVHKSSYVRHVPVVLALLIFALCVLVLPTVVWFVPGPIWAWEIAAVVLSFALAVLLARAEFIQRLLTPGKDAAKAVFRRAEFEFLNTGIPETAGRTGVLIFVSQLEHRAVILGDKAISEKLAPEVWVEILDTMIGELRAGRVKEAFEGAVDRVGVLLAREFPVTAGSANPNELANRLIVKE